MGTVTRLGAFCDGMVEAGWLASLIVAPVFFNHLSQRSFEPDKAAMLRSIVIVMAVAASVKWLERLAMHAAGPALRHQHTAANGGSQRHFRRVPLVLPALLLWTSLALSTVASVDPALSLWGSYDRSQGFYTVTTYLALFFAVLVSLRTREQFERIITAAVLAGVPVTVLALMQHHGLDPIPWRLHGRSVVVSSLGNTIFAAAWLIMLLPLALHRLLEAARDSTGREPPETAAATAFRGLIAVVPMTAGWAISMVAGIVVAVASLAATVAYGWARGRPLGPALRLWAYAVVVSASLVSILVTESRGPFVGLLASLFVFALAHTSLRQWRHAPLVLIGIGGGGFAVLALMSATADILPFVSQSSIGRLSRVFDTGGSGQVRLLIWDAVLALGASDPWRALGAGFGLDTTSLVLMPFVGPELASTRDALADRTHNATLDVLLAGGGFALTAYFALVVAVFVLGLRRAKILRSVDDLLNFFATAFATAAAFAVLARIIDGSWRLAALVLPVGILLATATAAGRQALSQGAVRRRGEGAAGAGAPSWRRAWSATLLAMVVAHVVEGHFGIGIVATQVTFWVLVAALVALGRRLPSARPQRSGDAPTTPNPSGILGPLCVLLALATVTLAFNFPLRRFAESDGPAILLLFGIALIVSGGIILGEVWRRASTEDTSTGRLRDVGLVASSGVMAFSVAGFAYSLPSAPWLGLFTGFAVYLIFLGTALIGLARMQMWAVASPHLISSPMAGIVYLALIGIGVSAIVVTNLKPLQADMALKLAQSLARQPGSQAAAGDWYRRAICLAPDQDVYYFLAGKAEAARAVRLADPLAREAAYSRAQVLLRAAEALRPLHPSYPAALGALQRAWGASTSDPVERDKQLREALDHYARAIALSPARALLWRERGTTFALLGDDVAAAAMGAHADQLELSARADQR